MTVVFRALKVKSIISDGTCILPESSSVSIVRAVSHAVEQAMTVAAFSSSFLGTLSRSTLCYYPLCNTSGLEVRFYMEEKKWEIRREKCEISKWEIRREKCEISKREI